MRRTKVLPQIRYYLGLFLPGLSFVALSRVRSMNDLYLKHFTFERLQRIKNCSRLQERRKEEERMLSLIPKQRRKTKGKFLCFSFFANHTDSSFQFLLLAWTSLLSQERDKYTTYIDRFFFFTKKFVQVDFFSLLKNFSEIYKRTF